MPNLRDLRRRIKGVQNMRKITKAMELVAAARMRRAQERVLAARPYSDEIASIMTELLKQPQYEPMPFAKQVISIFAGARGFLDDVPLDRVRDFEKSLLRFMDQTHPEIEEDINKNGNISDEMEKSLRSAVEEFKKTFAG